MRPTYDSLASSIPSSFMARMPTFPSQRGVYHRGRRGSYRPEVTKKSYGKHGLKLAWCSPYPHHVVMCLPFDRALAEPCTSLASRLSCDSIAPPFFPWLWIQFERGVVFGRRTQRRSTGNKNDAIYTGSLVEGQFAPCYRFSPLVCFSLVYSGSCMGP